MKTTQFSPPDNLVLVALPARWSDQDYELWTGDTTTQQHIITVQTSSNSPVSILARFQYEYHIGYARPAQYGLERVLRAAPGKQIHRAELSDIQKSDGLSRAVRQQN